MSHALRSVPTAAVEVKYVIRKGRWRWHGHIEYRKLPDAMHVYGTLWMLLDRTSNGAHYPLHSSWRRPKLEEKLKARASELGRLVRVEHIVSP